MVFADSVAPTARSTKYLGVFYNHIRIHSRHNMEPVNFENQSLSAAKKSSTKVLHHHPAQPSSPIEPAREPHRRDRRSAGRLFRGPL